MNENPFECAVRFKKCMRIGLDFAEMENILLRFLMALAGEEDELLAHHLHVIKILTDSVLKQLENAIPPEARDLTPF